MRHLFVLKLLQRHRSERSSVAHAPLCKHDDLPGNETCCGRQLYVGDRTQVWRHGHTGFLWATYGIDGGRTAAVRASLLCAPSGPPANAPGPPLGIANGRDAGTCRGGGPLGGLLCAVAVLGTSNHAAVARGLFSAAALGIFPAPRKDRGVIRAMKRALAPFLKAGDPLSSLGSSQEEGPFRGSAGSQAFPVFDIDGPRGHSQRASYPREFVPSRVCRHCNMSKHNAEERELQDAVRRSHEQRLREEEQVLAGDWSGVGYSLRPIRRPLPLPRLRRLPHSYGD